MEKASPIRNSVAVTAIATVCILVLIAATWVSMSGPQTVATTDVLVSTVILASLIFPLAYMWVAARGNKKKVVSARFLVLMSILWMIVSVVGITANLWAGLSNTGPWTAMRLVQFWAVLIMFSGMFVSSLVQLAAAADFYIRESAAAYGLRTRTA